MTSTEKPTPLQSQSQLTHALAKARSRSYRACSPSQNLSSWTWSTKRLWSRNRSKIQEAPAVVCNRAQGPPRLARFIRKTRQKASSLGIAQSSLRNNSTSYLTDLCSSPMILALIMSKIPHARSLMARSNSIKDANATCQSSSQRQKSDKQQGIYERDLVWSIDQRNINIRTPTNCGYPCFHIYKNYH